MLPVGSRDGAATWADEPWPAEAVQQGHVSCRPGVSHRFGSSLAAVAAAVGLATSRRPMDTPSAQSRTAGTAGGVLWHLAAGGWCQRRAGPEPDRGWIGRARKALSPNGVITLQRGIPTW